MDDDSCGVKTCIKCGVEQPKYNFGKNARSYDGLRDRCKTCVSLYNLAHRQKRKATHRGEDRAYQRAYGQMWYQRHVKPYMWAMYHANPDYYIAASHKRRARVKDAGGVLTATDIREIKKRANGRCTYCGKPAFPLHLDHVIALDNGGSNDRMNIVVACASCNLRKSTKPLEVFLSELAGISAEEMLAIL